MILDMKIVYENTNLNVMTKREEIFEKITASPVFYLATVSENRPFVRGMLLYKADENGIIFHTGNFKELYRQMKANPEVELCFNHKGEQIRISGEVAEIDDQALLEEIYQHPTRGFLRAYGDDIKSRMGVFKVINAKVTTWTMDRNLEVTEYFEL